MRSPKNAVLMFLKDILRIEGAYKGKLMFKSLANPLQALPARRREAISYLLLVLAVFAAYANVYHNAFLFDDQDLIITNRFLRDWIHLPDLFTHLNYAGSGREGSFYRPITMLMYMVVYQMFGL